jgi:aspartate/methionine/tyrosine aminotransferase
MSASSFVPAPTAPVLESVRAEALGSPVSGIVEVMNHGRGRQGLIPLWAGEGDQPTPGFICDAASRALAGGETFYTWQLGIPVYREAISRFMSRLYGRDLPPERFFATIGGMHAIQMAVRIACGVGDEVIVPSPAWPNFVGALSVSGATPVEVPMNFDPSRPDGGWYLDLDRLADAVTPRTRAIVINSPANPTGWTASLDEVRAILDIARRNGLWIIADEIYARFVHDGSHRAASFHDVMEPEDRILFAQTMSKNWAMTGWRVGWLEAHPSLAQTIENLVQYSSSGVAAFLQRGAATALDEGEDFIAAQVARVRTARDVVCSGLLATGRVRLAPPAGAYYAFFAVDGVEDTRELCLRLVDDALVGLAPGSSFGKGGQGFVRLCFARRIDELQEATRRLARALG